MTKLRRLDSKQRSASEKGCANSKKVSRSSGEINTETHKRSRIFITGHRGLLGSAIVDEFEQAGYTDLIRVSRDELDLTHQQDVLNFFRDQKPQAVIHCAALVGGIKANLARPADFIQQNLMIQSNVIHSAHLTNVHKLVFFGSNCMYPTKAPQPMSEDELLQGPIEPSNLAYGAAKVAGYVQCLSYHQQFGRNYFTVIPASIYGPNDNFDIENCHVTPALIARFHQAKIQELKQITIWGTGKPRRELLHVRDAATGSRLLFEGWHAKMGHINLGAGYDLSVREIAEAIQKVVGFTGELIFDANKPDGNMRKLLDSSKANQLGFKPRVSLEDGLKQTYAWLTSGTYVRGSNANT